MMESTERYRRLYDKYGLTVPIVKELLGGDVSASLIKTWRMDGRYFHDTREAYTRLLEYELGERKPGLGKIIRRGKTE